MAKPYPEIYYPMADSLADRRFILTGKADPLPIRQQRRWEQRALEVFRAIYQAQRDRIVDGISDAERAEIGAVIRNLYANEPAQVKIVTQRLFDELAQEMSATAIQAIGGAGVNADAVVAGILRTSEDLAALVGRRISDTSRDMTLSIVQDWLDTEGSTIGDLRERVAKVWEGPRPNAAARTEVTRLNNRVRNTTWAESGLVWGYKVVTRNDSLVRPSHEAVARGGVRGNGWYPLGDTQHMPPINDDINCRCSTLPVTFAEARQVGVIQ